MSEWRPCKKKTIAYVREVRGEKERVDTREGITYAYAATDFVMCGSDDKGQPNEKDKYPIKKETFFKSYIYADLG